MLLLYSLEALCSVLLLSVFVFILVGVVVKGFSSLSANPCPATAAVRDNATGPRTQFKTTQRIPELQKPIDNILYSPTNDHTKAQTRSPIKSARDSLSLDAIYGGRSCQDFGRSKLSSMRVLVRDVQPRSFKGPATYQKMRGSVGTEQVSMAQLNPILHNNTRLRMLTKPHTAIYSKKERLFPACRAPKTQPRNIPTVRGRIVAMQQATSTPWQPIPHISTTPVVSYPSSIVIPSTNVHINYMSSAATAYSTEPGMSYYYNVPLSRVDGQLKSNIHASEKPASSGYSCLLKQEENVGVEALDQPSRSVLNQDDLMDESWEPQLKPINIPEEALVFFNNDTDISIEECELQRREVLLYDSSPQALKNLVDARCNVHDYTKFILNEIDNHADFSGLRNGLGEMVRQANSCLDQLSLPLSLEQTNLLAWNEYIIKLYKALYENETKLEEDLVKLADSLWQLGKRLEISGDILPPLQYRFKATQHACDVFAGQAKNFDMAASGLISTINQGDRNWDMAGFKRLDSLVQQHVDYLKANRVEFTRDQATKTKWAMSVHALYTAMLGANGLPPNAHTLGNNLRDLGIGFLRLKLA